MPGFAPLGGLPLGGTPQAVLIPEQIVPPLPSGGGVFQQPRPRLLPPIVGRALTGQGRQSAKGKFALILSARGVTGEGSSWVDAEGFLTADAVVQTSQGQTSITHFWPSLVAGIRADQAEHTDAGMSLRMDLIIRSGGDEMIIPNYSDDPLPESSFDSDREDRRWQ